MAAKKCVVIIGGGFSGTLTAIQLVRQAAFPLCVKLVNSGYAVGQGLAYSSESDLHLLNVRAYRMSAFPHLPAHFVHWLEKQPDVQQYCQPGQTMNDAFMPRQVFGTYLKELLDHTMANLPASVKLELIDARATDVIPEERHAYRVKLSTGQELMAEKLVLALGNFAPAPLPGLAPELLHQPAYGANPWNPAVLEDLKPDEPVLLAGTGLTMVDVVLSLKQQKFTGPIIAVSPGGQLPMVHRQSQPYPDFCNELQPPFELTDVYAKVKKHIRQALSQGSTCEALIDTLRPKTQQIWQGLSLQDQQRFIRHLSSMWGVFRHRIAPQVADSIREMQESGQLLVKAGRVKALKPVPEGVEVTLKLKGQAGTEKLVVQRVINCTGPQCDYSKIDAPLVQKLREHHLVQADKLHLGIRAQADGHVLKPGGKPSPDIFTLGPLLRGVLWESTAVPEISWQASHLAQTVLNSFIPHKS
ncbi:MAG TPA: FAD/NAD(P)-binding protein [Adhaeribacter sp.]|nr:FAD/NAD(P)-binding protein [Adhaeribacter sp.]